MRAIHWFRQDLRVADNPALAHAVRAGDVLPIFILDDEAAGAFRNGGAARWWLQHALLDLNEQLDDNLRLYRGSASEILPKLADVYAIDLVTWTRCYEPWRIARDSKISATLEGLGLKVKRLNGSLLWEPWHVLKADKTPYRVFTPYFRKGCLARPEPAAPLERMRPNGYIMPLEGDGACSLDALCLLPRLDWADGFSALWEPTEQGALDCLDHFIETGLQGYKIGRDFPSQTHCSRLSPYLHWGQISPNQIWHRVKQVVGANGADLDHFLSELAWREFSYYLLYHFPDLPEQEFQPSFRSFEWQDDQALLQAWQKGQTGIPIVDAGMRELWQTGYMHNRVRMIVASFLVKNLGIDWRAGRDWFWDCLLDADLASNSASWQWVAGCGADAAPYFRVFNPVLQAQKFDPKGDYIRRYVPELQALPTKYLSNPWKAPRDIMEQAGIALGQDYPFPIVDLKESREAALLRYQNLRTQQG